MALVERSGTGSSSGIGEPSVGVSRASEGTAGPVGESRSIARPETAAGAPIGSGVRGTEVGERGAGELVPVTAAAFARTIGSRLGPGEPGARVKSDVVSDPGVPVLEPGAAGALSGPIGLDAGTGCGVVDRVAGSASGGPSDHIFAPVEVAAIGARRSIPELRGFRSVISAAVPTAAESAAVATTAMRTGRPLRPRHRADPVGAATISEALER